MFDIFAYSFYYHFLFVLLSLLFHYELTSARCRLSNSDPLVFASPTLSQTPWLLACCLDINQRTLEPLPRSPRRARNPLELNLRIRSTFSSRVCTIVATRACSSRRRRTPRVAVDLVHIIRDRVVVASWVDQRADGRLSGRSKSDCTLRCEPCICRGIIIVGRFGGGGCCC